MSIFAAHVLWLSRGVSELPKQIWAQWSETTEYRSLYSASRVNSSSQKWYNEGQLTLLGFKGFVASSKNHQKLL